MGVSIAWDDIWNNIVQRASDVLGQPLRYILDGQMAIDDLLRYFETGESNDPEILRDPTLPEVVGQGVLRIGQAYMAIKTVRRHPHPLLPAVKEADVCFKTVNHAGPVHPWRELQPDEREETSGDMAFTFTSALSLRDNLSEFVRFATAPGPDMSDTPGMPSLDEMMALQRQGVDLMSYLKTRVQSRSENDSPNS